MDIVTYYKTQSAFTTPGDYEHLFKALPDTIPELCAVVQGLVLHYFNDAADKNRHDEKNLRYVTKMITRILEMDDHPLIEARPPEKRVIGCCRDFATLFCAMARYKNIPTRIRVGFSAYFNPDFFHDHVVAECWDEATQRWHLVDPVLQERHIKKYRTQFNRFDIPRDQFIVGGQAWQTCRQGKADPNLFGFKPETKMKGWWFIRDKTVQDLAALNRHELLLWDFWGISLRDLTDADFLLVDKVADLTQADNTQLMAMRNLYETEVDLRVSDVVETYTSNTESHLETLIFNER
ncbi:MAG: transglutaminase domain-containing protein [Chloroflexota bacterium]